MGFGGGAERNRESFLGPKCRIVGVCGGKRADCEVPSGARRICRRCIQPQHARMMDCSLDGFDRCCIMLTRNGRKLISAERWSSLPGVHAGTNTGALVCSESHWPSPAPIRKVDHHACLESSLADGLISSSCVCMCDNHRHSLFYKPFVYV